jgi:hypothetical protein
LEREGGNDSVNWPACLAGRATGEWWIEVGTEPSPTLIGYSHSSGVKSTQKELPVRNVTLG